MAKDHNFIAEAIRVFESLDKKADITGGCTIETIQEVEKILNINLPHSYKEFLLEFGSLIIGNDIFYGVCVPIDQPPSFIWALAGLRDLWPNFNSDFVPIYLDEGSGNLYCIQCSENAEEELPIIQLNTKLPFEYQNIVETSANYGDFFLQKINCWKYQQISLDLMEKHIDDFEEKYLSINKIPRNHVWRPFRFCVQDVVLGLVVVKHSLKNNNLEVDVCLTSDAPGYEAHSGAKMTLAFLLSEAYKCGGKMEIQFKDKVEDGRVPYSICLLADYFGIQLKYIDQGRISSKEAKLLYLELTEFSPELIEIILNMASEGRLSPESVCFAVNSGIWAKTEIELIIRGSQMPDSILKGDASPEQRILFLHDINHCRSAILGGYLERKLRKRERSDGETAIDLEDDTRRLNIKFDPAHYAKTYSCDDEEMPLPWEESGYGVTKQVSAGKELIVLLRPRNAIEIAREYENDLHAASSMLNACEGKPLIFILYPKDFDEFLFGEGAQKIELTQELGIEIMVCPETVASIDMDASNRLIKSRILRQ